MKICINENHRVGKYSVERDIFHDASWNMQFQIHSDDVFQLKRINASMFHCFLFSFFSVSVPTGKPIITSAHNTSATSIYLAWKAPSPDTIHGEFLGYRIGYKPRDKPYMEEKEVYIRNPAIDVSYVRNRSNFFHNWYYIQYYVTGLPFDKSGMFRFITESHNPQSANIYPIPGVVTSVQPRRAWSCNYYLRNDRRRR